MGNADTERPVENTVIRFGGFMSLARLCAKIATPEEMATLLEELEKENTRLRIAVLWALGEHEEFPAKPDGGKPYWFRTELRQRAGLDV